MLQRSDTIDFETLGPFESQNLVDNVVRGDVDVYKIMKGDEPVAAILRHREYARIRELEDAVMLLWDELPAGEVKDLEADCPRLIEFLQHLHHSIEHEQALTRRNMWSE